MARVGLVFVLQALFLSSFCQAFCPTFVSFALPKFVPSGRHFVSAKRVGLRSVKCADAFVALTREEGKNVKLETVLAEKGVKTEEIPCIEFEDGPDRAKLPAALHNEWEYVVVTSPEAATVFLKGWEDAGSPDLRVASVGAGTKQILVMGGVDPVFVPSKATGKTLAAELPGPSQNGQVLYPASAKARKEVQDGLSARGFTCTRLNTYDTVSASWDSERKARAEQAAVVALASPSAVKTWVDYVGTSTVAACIGETSAKACQEAGFAYVFWPESPGIDGWADAVIDALEEAGRR